ncbi:MAG: hypothetical protein WBF38_06255 [Nitrosotalea sp.]
MKNVKSEKGLSHLFLEENKFFEWAGKQLLSLDEAIIVSHTPIVFFHEEAVGAARDYLSSLEKRFESEKLKTTYFMSHRELEINISRGHSIPDRIDSMAKWREIWNKQKNVQPLVVEDGYFPSVSLFIGKHEGKTLHTLIKISFDKGKGQEQNPVWLGIMGDIPEFENVLIKMKKKSVLFSEYLTERMETLSNLNLE